MTKETSIAIIIDPHLSERNPRCRKDGYFDTALSKLEYVAKNNDYVVIAGDLFHIHSNSTLLFNRVYTFFKKYKGKFHVIPGNHDVFHRNLDALEKTTIGSLDLTEVIDLHITPWEIAGLEFVPVMINTNPDAVPVDEDNNKILIGHKFYDDNFDQNESLFEADIKRLNYNMVFLGHDHKPYDETFVGNSMLIRMGSLTRIDTQCYNKDREIAYYRITTTGDGLFDWVRRVIPSKPIQAVYTEEAINHMNTNTGERKELVSFIQIGDVLSRLSKKSEGINSLDKTLRRIKTPEASIQDIKWRHEFNNVNYT